MASAAATYGQSDPRRDPREEVQFRARAACSTGRPIDLLVVNVSARGLMARCADDRLQRGDRLRVRLPEAGFLDAEIRWALGGRLGCEFDRVIDLASYMRMLAAVLKPA